MKKTFLTLACCFLLCQLYAQTLQLTLVPGSAMNRAKAVVKSNGPITGIISSVQITFMIPKAGLPGRPMVNIVNNYLSSRIAYLASTIDPSFPSFIGETATDYYYTFNGDIAPGATSYTFASGTEVDFLEVEFLGPTNAVNFRSPQRTDGGSLISSGMGGDFITMDTEGMANFFISVGGLDRTNTAAQYYSNAYTNVSNSGAGYSGESYAELIAGIVVPVKWLSFTAQKQNNDALLKWTVENETDNRNYILERSLDGTTYTSFHSMPAIATHTAKTYNYTDPAINRFNRNTLYYRVKQVDFDGRYTYSPVRPVWLEKGAITVFPNPSSDGFTLMVPQLVASSQPYQLILVNTTGQVVDSRRITSAEAMHYYFDLTKKGISPGNYMLKIFNGDKLTDTKKILVKQ